MMRATSGGRTVRRERPVRLREQHRLTLPDRKRGCSLQYSEATEIPPRKSCLETKKALWFTTPLQTATNPFPCLPRLSLLWKVSYIPCSPLGDLCQLSCAPIADDWSSNSPFSTACYSKLQTDITNQPNTHFCVCSPSLFPGYQLLLPQHLGLTPSTLPDHTRGLPDSIILCKTSSSTSKKRRMALP